jgi:hypothetical protein
MNSLLEAISEGWSWKIGNPISIIASNAFGNAIVLNDEGQYYRIIPEEWQCEPLASSPEQLEEKRKEVDFVRDWEMRALVTRAEVSEGPLAEGQVYYLVIPGFLGGKYSEENIRKISLRELLSYSGDMARQSDGLPDGAQIKIVVK